MAKNIINLSKWYMPLIVQHNSEKNLKIVRLNVTSIDDKANNTYRGYSPDTS